MQNDKIDKRTFARAGGGALLLALLGVCGYVGAARGGVQAASVPVEQVALVQDWTREALGGAQRLAQDREREIEMLDSVLANTSTDEATRQTALAQKTQIVERMEQEAQARACLTEMGFDGAQAVCGAQVMTILLPAASAPDNADRLRALDAVASQTGVGLENVKLILTN